MGWMMRSNNWYCGFISRLSTFFSSCIFKFQLTFSLLTGKGHAAVQASGRRCLRQVQRLLLLYYKTLMFSSFFLHHIYFENCQFHQSFLLRQQVLLSPKQTLHQSASGGPILWPTNGTSSRQLARLALLFRLWLCSSLWKYMPHERDRPSESWLVPSLLTRGSVMFRFSGSPLLL